MNNVLRFVRCAFALVLLLGMTPGWASAAPGDPYEINVILSLTGFGAFLGGDSQVALHLIEASVNKDGGIRGRPIKFVIADDKSDSQVALQLANGLIAKQVPFFLGPGLSATCNAILPQIATNGPLMYCFSPVIYPAAGSYGFVSGPSIPDYMVGTVRYLRLRGWKRIALITSIDATGQDGERSLDAALALPENKGVTLVAREHFNNTDLSVAAQMSHIKDSGAQAALFWATGTPFGTLLHGAFDTGLKIPISTLGSNLNYQQLESYQSFMSDDLYMMVPAPFVGVDQIPAGAMQRNVKHYLDLVDAAHLKPASGYVTAWDETYLMLDALRHTGLNATTADLRGYLAGLSGWTGINGVYDFKRIPQRGVGNDSLYMLDWNGSTRSTSVVSTAGGIPKR